MPIARVICSPFYVFSSQMQSPFPKSNPGFGERGDTLRCFGAFLHNDGAEEQHNANDDLRDPGGK